MKRLQSWKLEFDIRSAVRTDIEAHESDAEQEGVLDEQVWEAVRETLEACFVDKSVKSSQLMAKLAQAAELERASWPSSLLRRIGDTLVELETARKSNPELESRWLNLLGYAYRPGFGLAMDDWRIEQLWRKVQGSLVHKTIACRTQMWILWRRVAGGLSPGQQQNLAGPMLGNIRDLHRQLIDGRGRGSDLDLTSQEGAEIWRALGSLEQLSKETKIELGEMILNLITRRKMEPVYDAVVWTLGRLGARVLFSGPLNAVIPPDVAGKWLRRRLKEMKGTPLDYFAIMEMARKTGDRYREIAEDVREAVLAELSKSDAPENYSELVRKTTVLEEKDETLLFGESLPIGLRLSPENIRIISDHEIISEHEA